MRPLTATEEKVMRVLWRLKNAFLSDLYQEMQDSKLKITTVATVVKTLKAKKYISSKTVGRNNQYFPLVEKGEYFSNILTKICEGYFEGRFTAMLAPFLTSAKTHQGQEAEKLSILLDYIINNQEQCVPCVLENGVPVRFLQTG